MSDKVTTIIFWGLILLSTICAPGWFLGGNLPPVRTVCLAIMVLATAVLLLRNWSVSLRTTTSSFTVVFGLLLLSIVYVGIQSIDIPENFLKSQYPAATRQVLGELVLGIVAFSVFSQLLIDTKLLKGFFVAATATGVAITAFGLIQRVSWNGKLFWTYELIYGGQPFGPFVNGNNAGGFLLMCFAASNFFLVPRLLSGPATPKSSSGLQRSFLARLREQVLTSLVRVDAPVLYTLGATILIAAGIAASLSRGALVALAVSTLVGWLAIAHRRRTATILALILMAAGTSVALYAESQDLSRRTSVASSLKSLANLEEASTPRLEHWKVGFLAAKAHWATGSGLGTYSYVYPAYQKFHSDKLFAHAENQYLESFVELGLPGLLVLVSLISICVVLCIRLIRKSDQISQAVGVSGLICLLGQSIAGALDFGLYQPANSLLMAAMMGAVVARTTWEATHKPSPFEPPVVRLGLTNSLISGLILIAGCWATYQYSAVDAGEATSRYLVRFDPLEDVQQLDRFQTLAEYATKVRPDDARNHSNLARLEILRYRITTSNELLAAVEEARVLAEQEAATQLGNAASANETNSELPPSSPDLPPVEEPETEEPAEPTIADAWSSTELISLHGLFKASQQADPEVVESIVAAPAVQNHLSKAWKHLQDAEVAYPGVRGNPLLQAQLSFLFESPAQEQNRVARLVEAKPFSVSVLYFAGLLDQQSGRFDLGCQRWRKCMELSRKYDEPIIDYCRAQLTVKQVLNQVLPKDPERLLMISRVYFREPRDVVLKNIILAHTGRMVAESTLHGLEKIRLQSKVALASLQFETAVPLCRQLLENEPNDIETRMALARSLTATKQYAAAKTELKRCQIQEGSPQVQIRRMLNLIDKRERSQTLRTLQNR